MSLRDRLPFDPSVLALAGGAGLALACTIGSDGSDFGSGSGATASDSGETDGSTDGAGSSGGGSGSGNSGTASETSGATSGGDETTGGASATTAGTSGGTDPTGGTTGVGTTGGACDPFEPGDDRCMAPWELISCDGNTPDPFQAMGLNCGGDPNHAIPLVSATLHSADPDAWRVAKQFGTYVDPMTDLPAWGPREGESFLMLSTGKLPTPNANGVVSGPVGIFEPGKSNANPDDVPLPAPMSPVNGSNGGMGGTPFACCDGINDCSDSVSDQWDQGTPFAGDGAIDLIWLELEVVVPPGTYGYSFDFAFFSAEFPEYVGHVYNDMFVVWSDSQTYFGNLCFVDGQPCSVTALWPVPFQQLAPELEGTGLEAGKADGGFGNQIDVEGGGTGWYQVTGSAQPGETLQLSMALFDMGNGGFDSTVLVDNWRWDCEGCTPGSEVDACGPGPT